MNKYIIITILLSWISHDKIISQNLLFYDQKETRAIDGIYPEKNFFRISFNYIPSLKFRQELEQNGLKLHYYLEENTYLGSLPLGAGDYLLRFDEVQSVKPFSYEEKLFLDQTKLDSLSSENLIEVIVSFREDISTSDLKSYLDGNQYEIIYLSPHHHFGIIGVSKKSLERIIQLPFVISISDVPVFENHNLVSRTSIKSNLICDQSFSGCFMGNEVKIGINDDDFFNYHHIDFANRNFWGPGNLQNGSAVVRQHASHVAGTVGGAGNLNPLYSGFAAGSDLFAFRARSINGIVFENIPQSVAKGISLTQTSLGLVCDPPNLILPFVYDVNSQAVDWDMYDYSGLLHVFSAGNFGLVDVTPCEGVGVGWRSITGGYQMGKNIIAVGNLTHTDEINPSSSRGPAIDNRIKPDICAVGTDVTSTDVTQGYFTLSGTSMAAPAITGLLAQMTEAFKSYHNYQPDGGLLKALLLNSADDLGNKGPDYTYGWGKANGRKFLDAIQKYHFQDSLIDHNEVQQIDLWIPEGVKAARIMLYWTDYPAMVNSTKNLVNDLDLLVSDSASNNFFPWKLDPGANPTVSSIQLHATKGIDTLNNVEQVEIENPIPGTYTIEVKGTSVPMGPQNYFLVYQFEKDTLQLTFPLGGEAFRPSEDLILRWDAYSDTGAFDIDYTLDDGRSWTPIATGISGALRYQTWQTPAQISGQARVRITRGPQLSESRANFTIIEPPANIQFARVCQDFVTLTWDAVPGATAYDIFLLGEKYMDSVGTTTNTFFEPKIRYQDENWFSVRARGDSGIVGRRAIAVKQDAGMLLNCAGVAPTANFILDTVLCDSQWVFLQDRSGKSPDSWQWTVIPSVGVSFIQNTADSSANPVISFADTGSYQITLKAISQFGSDSITQTVRITSCNTANAPTFEPFSLRIIPNPNAGIFQLRMEGQLSGWYQLELLDLQGKKLLERSFQAQAEQLVQEVDVRQLSGGVYFLRVGDGRRAVVRKLILR